MVGNIDIRWIFLVLVFAILHSFVVSSDCGTIEENRYIRQSSKSVKDASKERVQTNTDEPSLNSNPQSSCLAVQVDRATITSSKLDQNVGSNFQSIPSAIYIQELDQPTSRPILTPQKRKGPGGP
ncbi:hypothetical protein F9C07_1170710 [Aspergillus flavus]|uniref:Uncharacterized protein n=1 Tax=Aspergillus flavus (strain ATCC 200026 / FGSC A1120 / IAM 13836 / NRRL 3357 / JCM 12722 / SRRC 167) TaxID=332952 RepID=A0A7U2QYT0_ASPFN|nr:hypothetical protein F9C07_1170710 [Aspergillus flavus]